MSTIEAAILIFLVMDPIGNTPLFICLLKNVNPQRRKRIIIRELCIALLILIVFLFTGRYILELLRLSEESLSVAGGIILFLIALKMVFSEYGADNLHKDVAEEPFIVPLAVPLIAGPSAMATVLLLMAQEPQHWDSWLIALVCAWLTSSFILIFSGSVSRILGDRTLKAAENLMGMLLTAIAVEMFLNGLQSFFQQQGPHAPLLQ